MTNPGITVREVPPEISKRLATWRTLYLTHLYAHYSLGICGVISSALAGFQLAAPFQQCAAGLATICIAVVGFIRPERKYQKFAQAWRTLDITATRYKYSHAELADLLTALENAESLISEFDRMGDRLELPDRSTGKSGRNGDESQGNEPKPPAGNHFSIS